MTEHSDPAESAATVDRARRHPMGMIARAALPIGVLALGLLAYGFLSTAPQKPANASAAPQLLRTKVKEVRAQDYPVIIKTHGVVRPNHEVTLTTQVPGQIVRVHPVFEDGAFFSERDVLIELDAADFETAVVAAEAQVARARAAHALEETRAKQARLNWEDLGYQEEPNELVLRLPQLREAKANVDAALAQLERVKRDLERTKVRAPFDGRVRRRAVGLGQSVGAGAPLGSVYAIAFVEVRLPIATAGLRFLTLPETDGDPPVEVELRSSNHEAQGAVWKGRIIRTEGALDENSLDLFAIARVNDPFGLKSGLPPLRIGQPVTGAIAAKALTNVVALPRAAVRQLDQVVFVDKSTLTLKPKTIVPLWSDEENIIVAGEVIENGLLLAMTHLVFAPDGAKVEIIPDIPAVPAMSSTNAKNLPKTVTQTGSGEKKP